MEKYNTIDLKLGNHLQRLQTFFDYLVTTDTFYWTSLDISTFDLGLYKKIRRIKSLRNSNSEIDRSVINNFGKNIDERVTYITDFMKLQRDYQSFLLNLFLGYQSIITPTLLFDQKQTIHKRIKNSESFKNNDGAFNWEQVHIELGGELANCIAMDYQSHINYSEKVIREKLKIFFETYTTRSPKILEKYDSNLYAHFAKKSNIKVSKDYRLSIQEKYGNLKNIFEYQYYDGVKERKLIQGFFEQHIGGYWSPIHMKQFNLGLYRKICSIKNNGKVDWFLFLYKYVDKGNILKFRHKHDWDFKINYKKLDIHYDAIEYRMSDESPDPLEILVTKEETEMLYKCVAQLSFEDQDYVHQFLAGADIESQILEGIIARLREMCL